jgi:hypothetical protein
MFAAAMLGPRLAAGFAPKRVAQAGLLALALASVFLLGTIDVELNETGFAVALAVFGVGAGLLLSQLGNVIMSSVDPEKTNEAGGLQGTAPEPRRLAGDGPDRLDPDRGAHQRADRAHRGESGSPAAGTRGDRPANGGGHPDRTRRRHRAGGARRGTPPEQAEALADDYGDAQLHGLKRAIGAIAVIPLLSLWFTRRLPGRSALRSSHADIVRAAAP